MAFLNLAVHVFTDFVHGDVSRSFDKGLYVFGPGPFHQFAHGVQFGKLGTVVGIENRPGTQTVTERYGHVVLSQNVADVVEMFIQETFLLMISAPLGDDASATAHHSAKPFVGIVYVFESDTAMNREIIHALFALFDQRVAEKFPGQVFCLAVYLFHGLVHRHCSYRYRTVSDNPFARFVDVLACRKVHQRIAAPFTAPHAFFHLLFDARSGG